MNDESYNTIIMIMIFMTILPITLMFGVSPLTVLHIYPIVLRQINIQKIKVDQSYYVDSGVVPIQPKTESHYKKPLHMKPLILTSVLICIGFLIIHVLSVMSFIQYGDEVLSSENYHNIIPITHAVLSLLAVAIGFGLTTIFLKTKISKSKDVNPALQPLLIPAAVISVNFVYIGCYFIPYMLLAFIHDPLLTSFTYLTLVLFIVCIYLICLGVCHLYRFYKHKKNTYDDNIKHAKLLDNLLYSCMVWAMAFSLMMFLFVVIYIITLGSFDDFKDLKYLIPTLPLAVVGLFLLRPVNTLMSASNTDNRNAEEGHVLMSASNTDNRNAEEGHVQGMENSDNDQTSTIETSDSDSMTQSLTNNASS